MVPVGTLKRCKAPFLPVDKLFTEILAIRDEYLPLTYFDAIYIIDLCEPLLEVARARIKARGWKNVHVLCQDASRFVLPEWESGAVDPRGSLTAITMSYSLSMASRRRHFDPFFLGDMLIIAPSPLPPPLSTHRYPHFTRFWIDVIKCLILKED